MTKTFKLKPGQWVALKARLLQDYAPADVLITWRCRERLGFTVRQHQGYGEKIRYHLDFWDDGMRTFFVLKYADYLERKSD